MSPIVEFEATVGLIAVAVGVGLTFHVLGPALIIGGGLILGALIWGIARDLR